MAAWIALTEIFGARFTSSYGDKPLASWAEALSGVTQLQLSRALNELVASGNGWPPTLPELIGLINRDESRLPDAEEAYHLAAMKDWSVHPAVYEAARRVGVMDVVGRPKAEVYPLFKQVWRRLGEELRGGLTHNWQKPMSKANQIEAGSKISRSAEEEERIRKAGAIALEAMKMQLGM